MELGNVDMGMKVNDAVQMGILETLINPEYSRDWILELAESRFGSDPAEFILDEIENNFLREMLLMAKKVVPEIEDASLRTAYEDIIADRESNLD